MKPASILVFIFPKQSALAFRMPINILRNCRFVIWGVKRNVCFFFFQFCTCHSLHSSRSLIAHLAERTQRHSRTTTTHTRNIEFICTKCTSTKRSSNLQYDYTLNQLAVQMRQKTHTKWQSTLHTNNEIITTTKNAQNSCEPTEVVNCSTSTNVHKFATDQQPI